MIDENRSPPEIVGWLMTNLSEDALRTLTMLWRPEWPRPLTRPFYYRPLAYWRELPFHSYHR
jgi:hypothetical protein